MVGAPPARVPVTVVTGFLGAGKTTLVNQWLGTAERGDVAVIVNEHGAIGIDGALLQARARTLVEIAGGCVCCSTQAELARALDELTSSPGSPKRILIETSGAASPAGVLRVIGAGERSERLYLDGVVTVVDSSRVDTLSEHDLAIEQVGYADIVVLSRADVCDAEQQARAQAAIATHNGAAFVVSASRGSIAEEKDPTTLEALLDRRRSDIAFADVAASTHTDHVYESIALVHEGALDGERFALFMESEVARFAGRLLRTKGILAIEGVDERMIVQGVADQAEVTFGEPWGDGPRSSRFVIVGFGLDRDGLTRAFRACAA